MTATPGSTTLDRGRGEPPAPGRPSDPRRSPRRGRWRALTHWFDERGLPWALVAPALLIILGLTGYPVVRTLWLSLHEAGLASLVDGEMEFVGLANYLDVFADPELRRVFVTTAVFGFACVAATMALGMGAALLLNRPFKGRGLLAVLVLLPWAMPRVAAATVWQWLFHDQYGVINYTLSSIGLESFDGFAWFVSRLPAFFAIGVVVVWQAFPFVALSLLAGLQSVSRDVLEAARIDGANAIQRLRHVTLPLLKPLILVLVVISTIWDFKVFDQVYVMTGGGPARATEVLAIATWREAFTQLDFGIAAALAMAMFAILTVVTLIYVRLIREDEGLSR